MRTNPWLKLSRNCYVPFFLTLITVLNAGAWQMKQAPLMTRWASLVDTNTPLPEYPRPQLVRTNWLNLNGIWQFQSGAAGDAVPVNKTLSSSILVPYPMESAISGVKNYSQWSWYRRLFTVPTAWSGKRIILHLDAVDWQSEVFINSQSLGVHKGGYDPMSYDVTPYLSGTGPQELIVRVYDPTDSAGEPRGKQTLYPGGIMYTSTSGIWQPVWLEPVDASGVQNLVIIPDIDNSRLRLTVNTYSTNGVTVSATVLDSGNAVKTVTGAAQTELSIPITNPKLWSPDSPFLYDLQISVVKDGVTNDSVTSYFGMRKISLSTVNGVKRTFLNNQLLFQMGPLDQGFWPDGLYTAPTDDALKFDIEQEKALGFNMVRKHIKVERQRWYYWADKLGIMVWQDMPSINSYTGNPQTIDTNQFELELRQMIQTHWNSPSIIMWVVFNEAQGQHDTTTLVPEVSALDPSRLVNQASGNDYYGVGDVLDSHSYPPPGNPKSTTQAPVDGEYGGIGFQMAGHLWNPSLAGGNYTHANTTNDITTVYDSFIDQIVSYKAESGLNAAVYTEITDVENECNGLLTYDRIMKVDVNTLRNSNLKAITGRIFTYSTPLPTSHYSGQTWKYTTSSSAASTGWNTTNFNDSAWSSGQAGFGTSGTPGAVVRTTWNTSDIWLRRQFTLGKLSPRDLNNLVFNCFHDEDCEIYLNGVLAASLSGYNSSYNAFTVNDAGKAALRTNAINLIAVHCHQTYGGQNIDVGLSAQDIVADNLIVPTGSLSYWPLNETNGTVATDAGSGNNGAVNGAAWSIGGQNKGCLSFNGLNSYVQVNNTIGGDFSISFWVKTTQTAGVGQWYQGIGLVDGDVSGYANDFGTALCGSKFAFGVGNPDRTISSVTSINDGAWHHCVATRAQSTGIMKVYVDGVLEATGTNGTQSLTAPANLRFGSFQTGGGYFSGSIDEVKIFDRELGHNEIAALYNDSVLLPAAPAGLSGDSGNAQVSLTWGTPLWATSYNVKRSTSPGGPYTTIANVITPAYTDVNLVNGVRYYYVVSALDSYGEGPNSSEFVIIPNIVVAWFKADAITGLANGASVTTWADASGNGTDATQTTANRKPMYVTGAINGLPVVRFTGSGTDSLSFNRPVQDDFTILCVFRCSQGVGTGTNFYEGAGLVNGEVSGQVDDFGTCINANGYLIAGTGNPDTSIVSNSSIYTNGLPHIMTFKRTRSNGALALYADGVLVGSITGAGTQSLTSPSKLVLGAQAVLNNYFTGDIAEVKIFKTPLSDNDRVAEENALKCKYGLSGGAAPSSPVGLTATLNTRKVALTWAPTAGAISYNVWWSTNGTGTYTLEASGIAVNAYTDANPVSGVTNYYKVAAADGCGASANSAAAGVFLPLAAPAAISSPGIMSGRFTMTIDGSLGANFSIQSATNLTSPITWSDVLLTNPASLPFQWSETNANDTIERFYRVVVP